MQTHTTPVEIARRFSSTSTDTKKRVTSETIAQEIAEFEARGGKIEEIGSPQFSVFPKRVSTGHDPQFLADNRSSAETDGDCLVNLTKVAKTLNVPLTTVSSWVKQRKLEVVETRKRGEKMVRLTDAIALKLLREKGEK